MDEIADWLNRLGMSEYAQRFAENDIDLTILADLTDQDLEKIGVTSLGHRRKLLRAIVTLHAGQEAASAAPPAAAAGAVEEVTPTAAATASLPSAPANVAGERRHVTVMFCDLVGSTGLAARLDAEEWRDLVGGYLDAASAAVTEMGGRVAKKLGDGLMALFGYPVAQENDAERAVRAALLIQRALPELNRKNEGSGRPALAARTRSIPGLWWSTRPARFSGSWIGFGARMASPPPAYVRLPGNSCIARGRSTSGLIRGGPRCSPLTASA